MQIQPHTLKSLKAQLLHGDMAEIARITKYSTTTVENAFKGEAITKAVTEIAKEASKIIAKRRKEAEQLNSVAK